MALTINLTDGSTTYNLHSATNYGVPYDGVNLGIPQRDRLWGASAQSEYDHLIRSIFRNRTASLQVYVRGSSHDNWITNLQNIQRMLYEGGRYWETRSRLGTRCYLDIALAGATNTTRFDVLAGSIDPGATVFSVPMRNSTAPTPVALSVPIELVCKPGGRPSTSTSGSSGSLTNNANPYTVSAPAGDIDMPCKVTFAPEAGIDFRFLWLYRRSLGTVADFLTRIECESGTFTNEIGTTDYVVTHGAGTTTEADAAASSGERADVNKTGSGTNSTLITIEITSNIATQYGKHRIWARMRAPTDHASARIRLTYGGSSGTSRTPNANVDPTLVAGNWRLVDLGYIVIPWPEVPSDVTLTSFKIALDFTWTAAFNWELDCLYLMPQTYAEWLYVDITANSAAQDKFISDLIDPRPRAYYTDSAGVPKATIFDLKEHTFFRAQRGKDNIFVPLWAEDATKQHVLADTTVVTVEFFPLFETAR